jgi:hypothetical protein
MGAHAGAQSFADLTEVRNPVLPYSALFEIEAGAIGAIANTEDEAVGLKDEISWDGHVYYRDEAFSQRRATLEAYAGRDGLLASLRDGNIVGDDTVTRLELRARPWQFWRDGEYVDGGNAFRPAGLYDGSDYEGYLGAGREASQGLFIEVGSFYRANSFSRSDLTAPTFTIPADYDAYGVRIFAEQSSVQLDRRRGVPRDGFVLTLLGEREWNDSRGQFGSATFQSELPSAVWRARGRLEWYVPSSDDATWEIFARGSLSDVRDRVYNFEAQRPLGHQWVDGAVRLRLHTTDSLVLTPFVLAQYSRVAAESGGSTKEFFFGGGAETYLHFSDSISLHAWYSYLDNESRPPIAIDEDVHGEHMFYVGMVCRFGAQRR